MKNSEALKFFGEEQISIWKERFLENCKSLENKYIYMIIPLEKEPENSVGMICFTLIHCYLNRTRAIVDGWINAVNTPNIITCAILARAQMEVTGAIAHLLLKLSNHYDGIIDDDEFNKSIHKLLFGEKLVSNDEPDQNPYNALCLIQSADKLMTKKEGQSKGEFIKGYSVLCEYAHPNFIGTTISASINKKGILRFERNSRFEDMDVTLINLMYASLDSFIEWFDIVEEKLKTNEILPRTKQKK